MQREPPPRARAPPCKSAFSAHAAAAHPLGRIAEPEEVAGLFDAVVATIGAPDIVVYNASARARGLGRPGAAAPKNVKAQNAPFRSPDI